VPVGVPADLVDGRQLDQAATLRQRNQLVDQGGTLRASMHLSIIPRAQEVAA
jgi:hypothetical protein